MPLSRERRADGRNTDLKTKKIGAIVVAVIALANTVLPVLVNYVRRGLGMMPSVFTVIVIVLALIVVVGLVAGVAAGKVKKKHAPWSAAVDSDGDMMHLDHYRRVKRQRTHYSADPCAYSELYSWRKSQAYDDPWDF